MAWAVSGHIPRLVNQIVECYHLTDTDDTYNKKETKNNHYLGHIHAVSLKAAVQEKI